MHRGVIDDSSMTHDDVVKLLVLTPHVAILKHWWRLGRRGELEKNWGVI